MAQIPTPRSYSQIVGDMVDVFLSKLALKGLKVGGPILSGLETAAQSDVRGTQDVFAAVSSNGLGRATGTALLRIGADEDLAPIPASPATGAVTVGTSLFVKKASRIYQGQPAPISGVTYIYVTDASSFPAGDGINTKVYIGRGTSNLEGPIAYTSAVLQAGGYWKLTLTTTLAKGHNLAEPVVLAQGGDRAISNGTVVTTPQGNATTAVSYTVNGNYTLLDGEDTLTGVQVVCQTPGIIGRAVPGAINTFSSAPFTGATVTNPAPFTNGNDAEQEEEFRERIRNVRATRSKGTDLSISTSVLNAEASDESARVVSANVVDQTGSPTTLYIDDGTGYEPKASGIAIESLVDLAVGGEQYFQLAGGHPVAKAFLSSSALAPFALFANATLTVAVGGTNSTATFTADQFRDIANATGFEVVAAINAQPNLLFRARTAGGGTQVALVAKNDSNEDLQIVPTTGDANDILGFRLERLDSLRLYKNDRLLFKDGLAASLSTFDQTKWSSQIAAGDTLIVSVDNTPKVTYTLADADFLNLGLGFATVNASNSLTAWAAMFNAKIPGITATVVGNGIKLQSNRGTISGASLTIDANSTLISKGMFASTKLSALGRSNDYTLDRNTGQGKLSSALIANDRLSAGTLYTRAFTESGAFSTLTVGTLGAQLWYCVDAGAQIISTGMSATSQLALTSTVISGSSYYVTITVSGSLFSNVQKGDWLIIWDPALPGGILGTFRVAAATATSVSFGAPSGSISNPSIFASSNGISFIRSSALPVRVPVPAGAVSPAALAAYVNTYVNGITAATVRSNQLRVTTNSYGSEGDIALVAADTEGVKLLVSLGLVQNTTSHVAAVEAANSDVGTPSFDWVPVQTLSGTTLTTDYAGTFARGNRIAWTRPLPTSAFPNREGRNISTASSVKQVVAGTPASITALAVAQTPVFAERIFPAHPYAIGWEDALNLVLDGDALSKSYSIPLYMSLAPTSQVVGYEGQYVYATRDDATALPGIFGASYDFSDHRLHAQAQAITNKPVDADATQSAVLWRFNRFGPDGNSARVWYTHPLAANAGFTIAATQGDTLDITIGLPGGAPRAVTLGAKYAVAQSTGTFGGGGSSSRRVFFCGVRASLSSSGTVVTATYTVANNITDHQFQTGDKCYVTGGALFPNGIGTVTRTDATHFTFTYDTSGVTPPNGTVETCSVLASTGVAPSTPTLAAVVTATPDIVSIGTGTRVDASNQGAFAVYSADTSFSLWFETRGDPSAPGISDTYRDIVSATNVQFYPIDTTQTNTTAASPNLATNVNALSSNLWVTGAIASWSKSSVVVLGSPVTKATLDAFYADSTQPTSYSFSNGKFYVSGSTTLGGNVGLEILGTAGAASLWTNDRDWTHERLRLMPTTAAALARYLSVSAITGLSLSAEIGTAARASKLQLASLTPGAAGSVQVTGGSGNSVTGSVIDAATNTTAGCKIVLKNADAVGLFSGMWCALQATSATPKALDWTSSTTLQITPGVGAQLGTATIAVTTGTAAKYAASLTTAFSAKTWQVERHGNFAAYIYVATNTPTTPASSWATLKEGDWVQVTSTPGAQANKVTARIVRSLYDAANNRYAFWIENPSAVEEVATYDTVAFYTADSIMPGDQLNINTSVLGSANAGTFTVTALGAANGSGQVLSFTVSGTLTTQAPTALGVNYRQLNVFPATPARLVKRINYVAPIDASTVAVVFDTQDGSYRISSSAGAYVAPLDKLGFPTKKAQGLDGYQFNTGLIAECNRIVYGDPTDTATYPGVIASGANINIEGPNVRRIQVSIAIRIEAGAIDKDVRDAVKAAVAAIINAAGVGEAIPFSRIVRAAERVAGVAAVTILSPVYGVGSDLIQVQPYEKPIVLNIDTDVLVSLTGT